MADIDDRKIPTRSLLKTPRQQRALNTVFSIIDATWELISTQKIEQLNTNRIAAHAGVNISSLYQYFANKEMIISAIIETFLLEFEDQLRVMINSDESQDPVALFETGIDLGLELLKPMTDQLRILFTTIPFLIESHTADSIERILIDLLRDFAVRNADRYRIVGGLATMYVLANAATMVAVRWICERPAFITEAEFKESMLQLMTAPFQPVDQVAS